MAFLSNCVIGDLQFTIHRLKGERIYGRMRGDIDNYKVLSYSMFYYDENKYYDNYDTLPLNKIIKKIYGIQFNLYINLTKRVFGYF